jgi:hypothetical protein
LGYLAIQALNMATRPQDNLVPDQPSHMQTIALVLMVAGAIDALVLQWLFVANNQVDAIPYNRFEMLVAEGRVTEVTVGSDEVRDKLPSGKIAYS